ncbi:GntR family transcriptional regulator [Allobranchiibius huperziae]|uniref:DNA-binding GntR family transcriptional regulator n=1 Tax=Allobranchiibius huperziae TaxID=1874116 RepID=A0A853DIH1_9MICO|nr:GntR family transcriptional regulator [Allobranchiibius huperziae]NYJ76487.1 DNA-binding GntR family transcriptional regulator [Allobranchiibius huperziae]
MRLAQQVRLDDGGLPRVRRPDGVNATTFVHSYLKQLILDLKVSPDTLLTEMDVANATGLSRTPVHEAFLRLHEERLVDLLPRRGALITQITARQVRELYDVRLLLETHAARLICQERIDQGDKLVSLVNEQNELYQRGADAPALIAVDRQFHSTILALAGNTVMATVNDSLGNHHQRTGVLSFTLDRDRCRTAVEQHRHITTALADFDLATAERSLREHLVLGERELERLLAY